MIELHLLTLLDGFLLVTSTTVLNLLNIVFHLILERHIFQVLVKCDAL